MAHTNENLYWFINHNSPVYSTRAIANTDMSYVDLSLQDNGLYLVDSAKAKMWDAAGKNIFPTANRDLDLLLKMTLSGYFTELASDHFKSFYKEFAGAYGLRTISGSTVELQSVWVDANKQIDCMLCVISGVDYFYEAGGNPQVGTPDTALCCHIQPDIYPELNEIGGFSDYMLSTLSGGQLRPEVALSGNTASVTDVIVTPDLSISKYIGTYSGANYEWDAAGNEITTMDKSLTLVAQIGLGEY